MGLFTVVIITLNLNDSFDNGYDLRFPMAWGFAYPIGRVLFNAGYWFDPNGLLRLPGLFFGGFWGNMAAALFCFLTNAGFIASGETNFLIVYLAHSAVMIFIVCASLSKAANKSKQE